MTGKHSWESPSSRLVLNAVLETLAELGYDRLTTTEIQARAGAAGPALGDSPDLDSLVASALEQVRLFPPPEPSGDLRHDLRTLLEPWRTSPTRDERALVAVLSEAVRNPRLRVAVHDTFDRPLMHTVAAIVSRASLDRVPPAQIRTLCWVLRGLILDKLRAGPRPAIDIELLVDFLIAGLQAPPPITSPGTPHHSARIQPDPTA